jgi:chaperone modulatory protein CbpM
MSSGSKGVIAGVVLSEQETVTLDELAGLCTVERRWVVELVQQGALEPLGPAHDEWRFSATALGRVRTAARLHRDLDLDAAGIALALDLLDEIEVLRARLRSLDDLV